MTLQEIFPVNKNTTTLQIMQNHGIIIDVTAYEREVNAFGNTIIRRVSAETKASIEAIVLSRANMNKDEEIVDSITIISDEENAGLMDIFNRYIIEPNADNPIALSIAAYEYGSSYQSLKDFATTVVNDVVSSMRDLLAANNLGSTVHGGVKPQGDKYRDASEFFGDNIASHDIN